MAALILKGKVEAEQIDDLVCEVELVLENDVRVWGGELLIPFIDKEVVVVIADA